MTSLCCFRMGRTASDLEPGGRPSEAAGTLHAVGEGRKGSGESAEQTGRLPGQSGEAK